MTDLKQAAERKAFEAWADDQGFILTRTVQGDDYQDLRTQGPWDAWQACTSMTAAESAPVAWKVAASYFSRFESIPKVLRDEAQPLFTHPAPVAASVPGWRDLAQRCLTAMESAVDFRKTGMGRPPEQTCMHEIEELRRMLAASPAEPVSEDNWNSGDLMAAMMRDGAGS